MTGSGTAKEGALAGVWEDGHPWGDSRDSQHLRGEEGSYQGMERQYLLLSAVFSIPWPL